MEANLLLVADFDQITAPLMSSGMGLTASMQSLEGMARAAVPSLLGWSLSVKVDGACVTLTSIRPSTTAGDVRASMRIPLSAFLTADVDGGVVFYASKPHAFVRLAVDFVPALGPATRPLRTDQDLNPDLSSVLSGVREMSAINRAIGVLIAGGDTPESARGRLQAAARTAERTLHQTAGDLLMRHAWANSARPLIGTRS
jgi:hypothetical protein